MIRADRRRAVEEKIERLVEEALESGPPETMTDTDRAAMHELSAKRAARLDEAESAVAPHGARAA